MSTLKNRIAYRCKLIESAVKNLIDALNSLELAADSTHHGSLKERLDKHLNKNVLQKIEALYAKIKNVQDEAIDRSVSDQMRWVRNYIQRLIEQRIKAGKCKNGSNHYEHLLLPAKETILKKLTEIARLASLLHQLPEEIQKDTVITEQALALQKQQALAEQSAEFQVALEENCVWARKQKAEVSVFISYAWASEQRPWEAWVQPFLQVLKQHLESAGILVYMDLYDSRYGFNSYHYMEEIDACSYVILIGTESLLDKFNRGVSSVCNELNRIRRRREQDVFDRVFSVIPLIVSGTLHTALPAEYERFTVIENFLGGSYIQVIKELLAKLYSVSPDFPDFANAWKFYSGSTLQPVQSVFSTVQAEEFVVTDAKVIHHSSKTYIEELRRIYLDTAFSGVQCLFGNEVVSIENCYVNLALIKEEEQKRKESSSSNNFKEQDEAMELLSSAEQFFTVQEAVKLEDIFNATEQAQQTISHTNRVLITGRAGVGKSTLCQFIVNQWAQKKLWQNRYQGVFRIPLRNLVSSNYTANREYALVEIINRECFADRLSDTEQKQLDVDLKNHPEKFLIILDGYDELSTQVEDQYLIKQVERLMQYPEVIITSRPQYVSDFAASKKLEIIGFSEENIERYVDNFFKSNKEQAISLKQQLEAQDLLKSLSHVPLNLELICSAWQKNNWQAGVSLTQLYQNLVYWLQYRYLKKFHRDYNSPSKQQALDDLTPIQVESLCSEWLRHLENIAWEMRQTGLIYIHKNRLLAGSHKQLRESGLLRLTSDKQFYYFAHLTFQEFFAARCVAKIIQNAGSQGNSEYEAFLQFFKENKFNPKLQVVWWFVAGLLKEDAKALDRYFNLLLQEPRDILIISEIPLFMHCLEQSDLAKKSWVGRKLLDEISSAVLHSLKNFFVSHKVITPLKLCPQFLNEKILSILLAELNDSDRNVKSSAARSLGELGTKTSSGTLDKIIIALLTALKDSDRNVKSRVANALGELGANASLNQLDEIINALLTALKDSDRNVKSSAADALGKLRIKASSGMFNKVIKALLKALKDSNDDVKSSAADALGELGTNASPKQLDEIINALLTALKDSDRNVKGSAADALRKLGTKTCSDTLDKIIVALLKARNDSGCDVKSKAVYILGKLGTKASPGQLKEIIKALLEALNDSERIVSSSAVYALGELGAKASPDTFDEIIKVLLKKLNSYNYRVADALGELGTNASPKQLDEIINALLTALKDFDRNVKSSAANALRKLGIKASPNQLAEIIKALLKALNDSDGDVKSSAIDALGELGTKASSDQLNEIIAALLTALNDFDCKVNSIAADALGELGTKASSKQLGEIISVSLSGSSRIVKNILFDLIRIGPVVIERDTLNWFKPKFGKMSIQVSINLLQQAVKVLQARAESDFGLKQILLPQSSLPVTPLMEAAWQGNLQQVKTLLTEQADTRCVNSKGKLAVHHAIGNSEILKLLIQNHQPIDLIFLENILSALDAYQGGATNKSADESLLDQLVLSLTGMKNINQEKKTQRKRLLAHLQSFGDNEEQELEGFVPREFLALHIANLLQLLAAIQLGHHDHQLSNYSQTEVISQLKRELLLTVQAAHFEILSNLAKNNKDLQTALAEMIVNALNQLSHDEELIYETGYTKHCIYVAFRRNQDKIIVRVDNLGDGITNRHVQGKTIEGEDGCKPYFIGAYEMGALKNNKALKNYLVAIIGARELSRTEALPKIYPEINQQGKIAQDYLAKCPAKKPQKVGNCVAKSFGVGALMRLGEPYRLLLSLESNLLTFQEPKQTSQPKKKIAVQLQFFPPSITAPEAKLSTSQTSAVTKINTNSL